MPNGNLTDRKFVSANSFSQNANGSLMVSGFGYSEAIFNLLCLNLMFLDDVTESGTDAVSNA